MSQESTQSSDADLFGFNDAPDPDLTATDQQESGGTGESTQQEQTAQQSQEQTQEQDRRERTVPIHALHEAREKYKEAQRQISDYQSRMEQQMEQYRHLGEQLKEWRASQRRDEIPDPNNDPMGYLMYENKQLKETQAEAQQRMEQTNEYLRMQHEAQQMQGQRNQLISRYAQSAQEYMQEQPAFGEAYRALTENRMREYMALGYSGQHAQQIVAEEELQIAMKAYEDGVNPAERIYSLAVMRGLVNGTQATQPDMADMRTLEQGVKNATGLNMNSSGSNNTGTLEALAAASDEEFDAMFEKMFPSGKDIF